MPNEEFCQVIVSNHKRSSELDDSLFKKFLDRETNVLK